MPTALVTGISGQDGSYLAELLLARGYRVVGTSRAPRGTVPYRLAGVADRVDIRSLDPADGAAVAAVVAETMPDEIYHLAAATSVAQAWKDPRETTEASVFGTISVLEAVRLHAPRARVLYAGTSELFGIPGEVPQSERTPVRPVNPYGAAKAHAYWMTASYRDGYGLHASTAILFNHESPRRGAGVVTRKITDGAARASLGIARELRMGRLDVRRDWGFAREYADAMWRMLQQETASDIVIGTGESHRVDEFCEVAYAAVGLDWRDHVVQDERFFRPLEVPELRADPTVALERLGWRATTGFRELVAAMVAADVERLRVDPAPLARDA